MVVHTWKLAKSEFGDSVFDEHRGRVWIDSDGDINERQTELATSLRILILTSEHPTWNYITGVVVRDGARCASPGIMPTDDEVREIGAHLESYCVLHSEFPQCDEAIRPPYDIDGAANLGYYLKRPDGGWCYSKRSWQFGPHRCRR